MFCHRTTLATLSILSALVLIGCSSTPTSPIEGKVVFEDQPVFPGTILFKNDEGKIHSANLNSEGGFRIPAITNSNYVVAIQTPDIDFNERPTEAAKTDGEAMIREKTIPAKFKNANTGIPDKFRSFAKTDLKFDFTDEIPKTLVINLDTDG